MHSKEFEKTREKPGRACRFKTIAFLLAVLITALGLMPMFSVMSSYAENNGVLMRLMSLKSKFPEGKHWNHVVTVNSEGDTKSEGYADGTTSSPCYTHAGNTPKGCVNCNYFDGAYQCWGFAAKVFFDIFGARISGLSKTTANKNISVGDYVRLYSETSSGHSGIVLSVSGNAFTMCECNAQSIGNSANNCIITWGKFTYYKKDIVHYIHAQNYSAINESGAINFESIGNDLYYLQNLADGKYMTAGGSAEGANVIVSAFAGNASQSFRFSGSGNWYHIVPSSSSALNLNPFTDTGENGAAIKLYPSSYEAGNDQHWGLERVDGGYVIRNIKWPNMVLASVGGSVKLQTYNSSRNQVWALISTSGNKTYTVSYDANGGTGSPAPQTKKSDTALVLSTTAPTREGYTFDGWSTSSSATGAQYKAGDIFTVNADTVLYAVWEKAPVNETTVHSYEVESANIYGMENWINSKNNPNGVGAEPGVTQILFKPEPWNADHYKEGLAVTVRMEALDGSSDDTFTTKLTSVYDADSWGICRVEPCLMDTPWIPVKNKEYKATFAFVDAFGKSVTVAAPEIYKIAIDPVLKESKVTLEKILVTHAPSKIEYEIGEKLDVSGLKVKAYYSDGSSREVTDYTVGGFSSAFAGNYSVMVSYEGKQDSFTVTVKEKTLIVDPSEPQIIVESRTASPGDEITVSLSILNNPGFNSASVKIEYDPAIMTLLGAQLGSLYSSCTPSYDNLPYITFYGPSDVTADGQLLTLTFRVADNAAEGDYKVGVSYEEGNIADSAEEDVIFAVVQGKVTVRSYLPGDINGDGKVNVKDLTRLMKYINHENVTVVTAALDVNGDGKVNVKDLTRLMKYINHEDVEIF